MFLVGVMTVTFFIDFGISPPSVSNIAEGFSFTAEPYATVPALGLIGAVIMPHNLYLHSALVLSRLVDRSNARKLWEVSFLCCFGGSVWPSRVVFSMRGSVLLFLPAGGAGFLVFLFDGLGASLEVPPLSWNLEAP